MNWDSTDSVCECSIHFLWVTCSDLQTHVTSRSRLVEIIQWGCDRDRRGIGARSYFRRSYWVRNDANMVDFKKNPEPQELLALITVIYKATCHGPGSHLKIIAIGWGKFYSPSLVHEQTKAQRTERRTHDHTAHKWLTLEFDQVTAAPKKALQIKTLDSLDVTGIWPQSRYYDG